MAQTKYVLQKALKAGLRAVVVLNKADRPGAQARISAVESELFDLFALHMVKDEQLEYPTLYASAKMGWALTDATPLSNPATVQGTMQPLYDAILAGIPAPACDRTAPFSFVVTQLEANSFLGKCVVGKIHAGRVRTGDALVALDKDGGQVCEGKVTKLFVRQGLEQVFFRSLNISLLRPTMYPAYAHHTHRVTKTRTNIIRSRRTGYHRRSRRGRHCDGRRLLRRHRQPHAHGEGRRRAARRPGGPAHACHDVWRQRLAVCGAGGHDADVKHDC